VVDLGTFKESMGRYSSPLNRFAATDAGIIFGPVFSPTMHTYFYLFPIWSCDVTGVGIICIVVVCIGVRSTNTALTS